MQSPTMTAEDVARLAMVSRQAVTNWRRRPNTAAGMLPFPPPLSADGVERFAADEVVAWLEKTGRGRNAEARADAPAFSLREGFSLDEVVTMLALRSMCDCDLTALSAADLAALAYEADPDDAFLGSEVVGIGVKADLLAYVDDLHESAFGLIDALDRAEESRLGRSGHRGLTDAAVTVLASITTACRLFLGGDVVALDPRVNAPTARVLAEGFAGVTVGAGHVDGRRLRRTLTLADVELVSSDSAVRVLSVVGETDHAALQVMDDLVLDLGPADVGVILGPSSLLCDGLRGQLDAMRADTLSGGGLVMAARLPRGLWTNAHRQQLGLWIVAGVEKGAKVVVADLTATDVNVNDLASDASAALTYDSATLPDASRAFRYGRAVDRAALSGRRPLVAPGIRAIQLADAAHGDHRDRVLAATLITSQPLPGFDVHVAPGEQQVVVSAASLGELLAAGRIDLLKGTRVDAAYSDPVGTVRAVSADPADADLLLDPLVAAEHYPRARRTEPGDVVFVERPRPHASVDHEGGSLVRYPSRALRLPPDSLLGPLALAAVINRLPSSAQEYRAWNVPLLRAGERGALEGTLAAADAYLADLHRRTAATNDLIDNLIQGAAAGTLALTPTTKAG